MRFRFRLGPFTFGRGGIRLSVWSGGTGVSIPLSKKKRRAFGKVSVGPVSAYLGGSSAYPAAKRSSQAESEKGEQDIIGSDELAAIEAFGSDRQFLNRLRNYGVPWRGVQERLAQELPEGISNRGDIAYRLVPKAMDVVFGQQNAAWKTERRPSRSGQGFTTWIVIVVA